MQFEGGATATLQMVAFTERVCAREVLFYGTKVNGSYIQSNFHGSNTFGTMKISSKQG